MKKVLYITNIESPYRVKFFNLLAEQCDLTVLYEREKSANRNADWAKSETCNHKRIFMKGIAVGMENAFSMQIVKEILKPYDAIIVGCYNSPVQMFAMLVMRLLGVRFMINLDGEPFLEGKGLKTRLKRFFLKGAQCYLVAGEKAAESLRNALGDCEIVPYYFSSLANRELAVHAEMVENNSRGNTILVVAQYLECKGIDLVLQSARMNQEHCYKFVGMGSRTEQFRNDFEGQIPSNVEIIPFLQKKDLEAEYRKCAMLVLPSRQECWGLVVNEAASFGTPIVSTWGSGAAVEFLADNYPQYLAQPDDAESLLKCIQTCMAAKDTERYSSFLKNKSKDYSIERSVQVHIDSL